MSDSEATISKREAAPDSRITRSRRRWRKARIAAASFVCILFTAAGTLFGHFYWGSKWFQKAWKDHGWEIISGSFQGDPLQAWAWDKQFPNTSSMNVLILGVDHDYDNRDQIIKTTNGRSDSILLARVDFIGKRIDALTIPRDTAVRIPGHRGISKINAAHQFGGPELTMETIESVFGVHSDGFVRINFEGFQKVVDSLGGIDVNVQVPRGHKGLDYDDNWGNLHIHLKPGYQHLDGYKAMGFVRMRHSDSDEMRSKRQHEFLEAMRAKVKSPSTLLKLPDVITQLDNNLGTSLTHDQLLTLVNFARSLPKDRIAMEQLPSEEGPSYVTVKREESLAAINRIFFPNQVTAFNIDAPDPNDVRGMNSRYDRSSRHSRKRASTHGSSKSDKQDKQPTAPPEGLSVEPSAPQPSESKPVEPAPASAGSGDTKPTDGDKDKTSGAAG